MGCASSKETGVGEGDKAAAVKAHGKAAAAAATSAPHSQAAPAQSRPGIAAHADKQGAATNSSVHGDDAAATGDQNLLRGSHSRSQESEPVSDSASSAKLMPVKKMFPEDTPAPTAAAPSGSSPPVFAAGGPFAAALSARARSAHGSNNSIEDGGGSTQHSSGGSICYSSSGQPEAPPELAHVLSLLSRLLNASAVMVELPNPRVTYIRGDSSLRTGDAAEVRMMAGYQEVDLIGRAGLSVGKLGAASPTQQAGAPNMLLSQMANVVVREVEMMMQQVEQQEAAAAAAQSDELGQLRPAAEPAVLLVDTATPQWRVLMAETDIDKVTGLPAEEWKDSNVWDHLAAPFGNLSAAFNAVNEVTAAAGDLVLTGVGCHIDPSRAPLTLRCIPATPTILAGQGRPQAWLDLLTSAPADNTTSVPISIPEDAAVESQGAPVGLGGITGSMHQQQQQAYLVTVSKELVSGIAGTLGRGADGLRWPSSSAPRQRGSGGPLLDEAGAQSVPIEGVNLGPLLGKGSYGRVYHGHWHGQEVAIKVCNQGIARSGDRTVKPWAGVEAVASLGLHHPHVMRTFNHTTVIVPVPQPRASARRVSHNVDWPAGLGGSRGSLDMPRPPPVAMVRSASSDLDLAQQNTSHGTLPSRIPLSGLGVGDASPAGVRPPGLLSPFAEVISGRAPGGSGGGIAPPPVPSHLVPNLRNPSQNSALGGRELSSSNLRNPSATPAFSANSSPPGATVSHLRNPSGGYPVPEASGNSRRSGVSDTQQAEVDTWVIMEFCNRGNLQRALEDGLFSIEDEEGSRLRADMLAVLTTARQLAAAMAYMHSRGVIHGDLSRANILLLDSDTSPCGFDVKVADFGMSRQLDVASRIDTFSCGTITHTAPELMDEGHLSKATDVFATGVLLWELLNGSGAWAGLNQAQIISAVLIHNRRPEFPEDAPQEYRELSEQCMAQNPRARPKFDDIERRLAAMLERLTPDGQLLPPSPS